MQWDLYHKLKNKMIHSDISSPNYIYELVQLFKNKQIDSELFSDLFCESYNKELDFELLTEEEYQKFQDLSKVVSRYTPFKEEQLKYSDIYYSDEDLQNAIKKFINKAL